MMEQLRKPFFFAALGTMIIILLVEVGAAGILGGAGTGAVDVGAAAELLEGMGISQTESLTEIGPVTSEESRPGRGILYLMLVDSILLFTVSLVALSLLIRERIQGRIQGITTFVFSLGLVIVTVTMIVTAVTELAVMVSLLLAPPFGTAAYMATYASFDRGGAALVLSVLMTLKFIFSVLLILAQQRFLQNRGLVTLIIASFVATIIVSFLHGLVPLFLVSITDAIAALIVAVMAGVWGIILLFGSVKSVAKAIG